MLYFHNPTFTHLCTHANVPNQQSKLSIFVLLSPPWRRRSIVIPPVATTVVRCWCSTILIVLVLTIPTSAMPALNTCW